MSILKSDDLIDAGVVVKALLGWWRGDPWVLVGIFSVSGVLVWISVFVRIEFWAVLMMKEIQGLAKAAAFS